MGDSRVQDRARDAALAVSRGGGIPDPPHGAVQGGFLGGASGRPPSRCEEVKAGLPEVTA